MQVIDYINESIKTISTSDSSDVILRKIDQLAYSHFPIFRDANFIGNITRELVLKTALSKKRLEELDLTNSLELFKVNASATILDCVSYFNGNQSNMLPVFDEDNFLGIVLVEDVLEALSAFPFFQNQAFTMVVRIPTKKYSINQISKIIESNNAKSLGVLVYRYNIETVDVGKAVC